MLERTVAGQDTRSRSFQKGARRLNHEPHTPREALAAIPVVGIVVGDVPRAVGMAGIFRAHGVTVAGNFRTINEALGHSRVPLQRAVNAFLLDEGVYRMDEEATGGSRVGDLLIAYRNVAILGNGGDPKQNNTFYLAQGFNGFIPEETSAEGILEATKELANGGFPMTQTDLNNLVKALRELPRGGVNTDDYDSLSPRERDVLRLIKLGASNKEIATQLEITESTAKTHVSSILGKLDKQSRVQL